MPDPVPPTPLWSRATDPTPNPVPPVPWYKDIGKILLLIAALSGLLNTAGNVINGIIGNLRGEKIDHIAGKVEDAATTAADVKATLKAETAKTAVKLSGIEEKVGKIK